MNAILSARLKAASEAQAEFEPARRLAFADDYNANEETRRVRFYPDGSLLTVERDPMWEPYEDEKLRKRGEVKGFSAKSRKRFLLFVASLSRHLLPLFVTLTYPGDWSIDSEWWKSNLQTWWKRLIRKFPEASAVWKLEPQDRGAPHYHLLLWGVEFLDKDWLARSWFESVGSGDERHLRAGTSVERARSAKGVMCYSGKRYLGKEIECPACWGNPGRFWGVMGRKHLPRSRVFEFHVSKAVAHRFRRIVRKKMESAGKRFTRRNVALFQQAPLQWIRAMDLAESGLCHPCDFTLHPDPEECLLRTPF